MYTGTELYINGSKFHNNTAHNGGHIAIIFVSNPQTCANATIAINNSLFKTGKVTGGGGAIAVLGPTINSQCTNGNHIAINNTHFMENYAQGIGGAVSLLGCIGTDLSIDKLQFYNNTSLSAGGHIALLMLPGQILDIRVNNSYFGNGKASVGGGLSVFAFGNCTSISMHYCTQICAYFEQQSVSKFC